MSKHVQKYPDLYARCRDGRYSYQTVYMRCRGGMTVDEALALPVAKCGRTRKLPPATNLFPCCQRDVPAPKMRKRYISKANDTSPGHIRALRAAYCDHFIKTGELNVDMLGHLKEYANAQSSAARDALDAPDSKARYTERPRRSGDDPSGARPHVSKLGTLDGSGPEA